MNTRRARLWIATILFVASAAYNFYQNGRIRQLQENNQLLTRERLDEPVLVDLRKTVLTDDTPYLNLTKIKFPDNQVYACGRIRQWPGTGEEVLWDVNDMVGTIRKRF